MKMHKVWDIEQEESEAEEIECWAIDAAAELYVEERNNASAYEYCDNEVRVCVRDPDGVKHVFDVNAVSEPTYYAHEVVE